MANQLRVRRVYQAIAAVVSATIASSGAATLPSELSIEELINIEITSVSKKETRLLDSPAAVAVLTQEDFSHLGAQTVPEALRAVPGVNVARINANKWAVSVRGFNDEFANKLLVMQDGRTIYSPSIGGVYWNQQDVLLQDLERIEVVRGPGGTLWGANAVNGVINVITRSARETQGFAAATAVGTEDQPSASLRYGGQLASNVFYRVYAKGFNRDGFDDSHGNSLSDGWHMGRGGVRVDWDISETDALMLSGEFYKGVHGEQVFKQSANPQVAGFSSVDVPTQGGHTLSRWTRTLSDESEFTVQAYYDRYELRHAFGGATIDPVADVPRFLQSSNAMSETRDTVDLDIQHRLAIGSRHDFVWGAGYRFTQDQFGREASELQINSASETDHCFSAFLQDELALVQDRLQLTLGSKYEHNEITGSQFQPGARLLWTPSDNHSVWASVARAVRTPTRMERGLNTDLSYFLLPDNTPLLVNYTGSPGLAPEKLVAWEAGYRIKPSRTLSFDISAFYNRYEDLIQARFSETQPGSFVHANVPSGNTCGAELLAQWQVTSRWRLTGNYSWLNADLPQDDLQDTVNPQHQFHLRSHLELSDNWSVDGAAYFVDATEIHSAADIQTRIPAYVRLDLGVTWRPTEHFELSLWGQNLLDEGHPEYPSLRTPNIAEVPRSFFASLKVRF